MSEAGELRPDNVQAEHDGDAGHDSAPDSGAATTK